MPCRSPHLPTSDDLLWLTVLQWCVGEDGGAGLSYSNTESVCVCENVCERGRERRENSHSPSCWQSLCQLALQWCRANGVVVCTHMCVCVEMEIRIKPTDVSHQNYKIRCSDAYTDTDPSVTSVTHLVYWSQTVNKETKKIANIGRVALTPVS